jgi:hypothetical protein
MTMGDCKSVGKVVAAPVIKRAKFMLAPSVSGGWSVDMGGGTAGSSICSSMIDSSHARNSSGLSASG